MSDKLVYSSDPDWGKPGTPRQPEPVRLAFSRGAKGSGVTRVERLVMHPTHKDAMLGRLKKALGCGGTLKDGTFEFQGDHRDKLEKMLLADGYKVKRIGAFVLAVLLLASSAFARPAVKGISQGEAERRAALVSGVEYGLALSLSANQAEFTGRQVIRFTLSAPDELTIDFTGGSLTGLRVNGAELPAKAAYNGLFISLPRAALRAGANEAVVDFTHPYSADGAGLYRFKDPADGRSYVYSNFEPYDANKMFPCFDQPDLKASFRLSVDAPAEWTVVSASAESGVKAAGPLKTWTFGPSDKMSTYVFSVHAGPFRVWTSTAGAVPLRLFARESLAPFVRAEEWLEVTSQGLGFYGSYFAFPYPFKKYDQLIVPDFNAGAMENAGAVTFSERYVFRSTPTLEDREDLAGTILHEMAHMWFGDLVTMKWWNGLWLNESFATYMASLAAGEATRFRRAWITFFADMKPWAYDTDLRDTTHPVEGLVPDTEQAFANFDGITYGKGGSALKQLAYAIGAEKFRDGVRAYLKTHAYGNAVEADFFAAMSKSAGTDLDGWTREWLRTTGVNSVKAEYACADGKIASFTLVQGSGNGVLRSHRTAVALYYEEKFGALEAKVVAPAAYAGARTEVPALLGKPCPALVYPNHGDEDYATVELDDRSLKVAKTGLAKIRDPLARMMLWRTLWEMVRDAKWPVGDYAELALSNLGGEKDLKVAAAALATVYGRRPYSPSVLNYLPAPDYPRWEKFFWSNALKSEPGSDFEKLWYDAFAENAASPAGAARLRGLLAGEVRVPGLPIDQDRRWTLVSRLSELGAADAEALVAAESARDSSDLGVKGAIKARAARPDYESKREWLDKIAGSASALSLGEQRAAMAAFHPRTQLALRERFAEPFFRSLPEILERKDGDFLDDYTRAMLPVLCTPASVAAFDAYLRATPPAKPVALRALRDARQEEERCVRIRAPGPR